MNIVQGRINREKHSQTQQSYNTMHLLCILLLPLFVIACGGKLGTIEMNDVDSLFSQAEDALNAARDVNAQSLAFETYEQAETELEKAKEALSNKKGVDVIKYANSAITYAKMSKRIAIQNTKDAEANANLLSKDVQIGELRKQITTKDSKLTDLEDNNQLLQESESGLKHTIQKLNVEKQELKNAQTDHNKKIAELNSILNSMQNRVDQLESDVKKYGREHKVLSGKVDAAERIAKTESRLKRAAIAETESVKRQMREQARIFTEKLADTKKRNVAVEHEEFVRKQAEKARAFANQLPSTKSPRTGRTSLSTAQINAGKAALSNWDKAWKSKKLQAHFASYTPNVTINHIVIRESKENASTLNKTQAQTKLREMNSLAWTKSDEFTEVEQDSVIGTYRFSRLVTPAETEDDTAMYELWIREVWAHQVQGKWKIHRETWQVYENIPKL